MNCQTCFAFTDEKQKCAVLQPISKTYRETCPFHQTLEQLRATEDKCKRRLVKMGSPYGKYQRTLEITAATEQRNEKARAYYDKHKA